MFTIMLQAHKKNTKYGQNSENRFNAYVHGFCYPIFMIKIICGEGFPYSTFSLSIQRYHKFAQQTNCISVLLSLSEVLLSVFYYFDYWSPNHFLLLNQWQILNHQMLHMVTTIAAKIKTAYILFIYAWLLSEN